MVANRILGRVCQLQVFRRTFPVGLRCITCPSVPVSREFSSDSGDEKGRGKKKSEKSATDRQSEDSKGRQTKAKAKLNDLLQSIVKDQESREIQDMQETRDRPKIDFKLARSVKEKPAPATEEEIAAKNERIEKEKEIGKEMLSAVKSVATSVEGDPKQVETELVQRLMSHSPNKIDFNELFSGMKVDSAKEGVSSQTSASQDLSRAQQVRKTLDGQRGGYRDYRPRSDQQGFRSRRSPQQEGEQRREPNDGFTYRPIDLFGQKPLGIFIKVAQQEPSEQKSTSPFLKTWDALYNKELKSTVTHPPANGFEEMILWTEQGKLWKFPIDNEQDLDIEAKVPFHEHVFLEPHIERWCPKRGPLRHFMELVCIGLAKNPYLTVQEKQDHIEWYHQYFLGKTEVIKEIGGMEAVKQ